MNAFIHICSIQVDIYVCWQTWMHMCVFMYAYSCMYEDIPGRWKYRYSGKNNSEMIYVCRQTCVS